MEENATVFFQGEVTYSQKALQEVNSKSIFFSKNFLSLYIIFCAALLCLNAISLSTNSRPSYEVLFLLALFWITRLIHWIANRDGGITYKRMLSQNDGIPVHQLITFNNYRIQLQNPHTGNHTHFQYEQVGRLAETKNFYVLLIVHNQYILIDKSKLSGGDCDAFIRFICNACPNLQPKKLCSSMPGIILYCLSILLSVISLLLMI